ncbi:hypothetical protein BA893_11595 [Vibrio natriegens]|nr:hypothetical protein BA891_10850 [Vibrio natriegens]ANQ22282.1 hypothetical protein BA893_11595 [Vibrio natriegens]ANQ26997.1 hypothetical protein BA894_11270 [Vibrio natriegens]AXT71446.1 hypothetical protein DBX26_10510 [Vibrio sp. dhg]
MHERQRGNQQQKKPLGLLMALILFEYKNKATKQSRALSVIVTLLHNLLLRRSIYIQVNITICFIY